MKIRRGVTIGLLLVMAVVLGGRALAAPTVLVDQGHGQAFRVARDGPLQLTALAETIRSQGLEIKVGSSALTREILDGVQAVVISGPFAPVTAEEISALLGFLESGGRLAVMLHIAPPAVALLDRLGVDVANGVVRQPANRIEGQPLDFFVSNIEPHEVTAGLERFAVFGSWALRGRGDGVRVLARTLPSSWVDLDRDESPGPADAVQSFAVAIAGTVGRGEFVVFADDAIFQNRFLEQYNRPLAQNLARWLAGG